MKIQIKQLRENVIAPERHHANDAGADLFSSIDNPVVIQPGKIEMIPSGISIAIPDGYAGFVMPKSGLATKKGQTTITTPVDSGYRGEVIVMVRNISDKEITVEPNTKIAQLVIWPISLAQFELVDELEDSERGEGGFGSTGLKQK